MRLDLAGEVGVHGRFTSRADGDRLLEVGFATLGNPCYLSGETFEMLLFALEVVGADEDGEVGISDFERLTEVSLFLSMRHKIS